METVSQAARLKGLGCQIAQGFYFAEPLRAEEFGDLLTRHFAPMRCAAPGAAELAAPRPLGAFGVLWHAESVRPA